MICHLSARQLSFVSSKPSRSPSLGLHFTICQPTRLSCQFLQWCPAGFDQLHTVTIWECLASGTHLCLSLRSSVFAHTESTSNTNEEQTLGDPETTPWGDLLKKKKSRWGKEGRREEGEKGEEEKEVCTQITIRQDATRKILTQDVYWALRKEIKEQYYESSVITDVNQTPQ